ncbi:MAG: PAS domain-containing sensor histidine kinase [Porticoccaceae bacterium]|nr:PAS domain-containing sensor histidine kinase [Porticoccaceae bacterium]
MSSATGAKQSEQHNNSNLLRVYSYYRLLLAALLCGMYITGLGDEILGSSQPQTFLYGSASYAIINFATLLVFGRQQFSPRTVQIFAALLLDIFAITLLMNASGGIQSGLAFLLVVCVAAGSLFVSGQLALLLAASASVCVIVSSASGLLNEASSSNTVFQAGLLGILLFVTALIFQLLTRRLHTAQQEARLKTRRASQLQQLNEHIVRRMRTGIVVIDDNDTIRLINDAALQLLGGHPVSGTLAAGHSIELAPTLHNQLKHWRDAPWLRTMPFKERNASREVQANFTTLEEGEDGKVQTLIFLEDTRTLAQHAQQIKQASLGRLTGSIAHEIRNPLGAISHASQLLEEDPALGAQSRMIQIIKKQSDRVNQIIENVMQLSRQQTPNLKKLELNSWLKGFIRDYTEGRHQKITIQLDEAPRCRVLFDPSHLAQILTNLLDNGIRYSHQQTGEYWAELRPSIDAVSGHPYLDAFDRGPGVPNGEQNSIFEPFFTTSHEGSGLGLYVCRELCELNFATLNYLPASKPEDSSNGCFRIGFAHPNSLLPGEQQ